VQAAPRATVPLGGVDCAEIGADEAEEAAACGIACLYQQGVA
jgi:hypothetical protein